VNRVLGSECPQCGADVIAPEWSEHVSDHCIRNVWSCDACGRGFEDLVCLPASSTPKSQRTYLSFRRPNLNW
jgi:hypothetical protein